jgi:molybdopterin converting factor small subunit
MPTATVRLSPSLTFPEPEEEITCDGLTVGEVLRMCCSEKPRLEALVSGRDGRRAVGVFLNGRSIEHLQGLQTEIHEGDTILLLAPIAGG